MDSKIDSIKKRIKKILIGEVNVNEIVKSLVAENDEFRKIDKFNKINQIGIDAWPAVYQQFLEPNIEVYIGHDDEGSFTIDNNETELLFNMLTEKLKDKISKLQPGQKLELADIVGAVTEVIFDFSGSVVIDDDPNQDHRKSIYYAHDDLCKLSDFKGQKCLYCVERSAIAHQLFKMLGIESQMVYSNINIDNSEHEDGHTFVMIRVDNKTYIYDANMLNFTNSDIVKNYKNGDIIDKKVLNEVNDTVIKNCLSGPFDKELFDDFTKIEGKEFVGVVDAKDKHNNPIYCKDKDGKLIPITDKDGKPITDIDKNGNIVYIYKTEKCLNTKRICQYNPHAKKISACVKIPHGKEQQGPEK